MSNEWSNGIERARESDRHLAAMLTSAMLSNPRQPSGHGAISEAAHAANLYRSVLAALNADHVDDATIGMVDATRDSDAMRMLGVTRDGGKFAYRTYRYDKLEDALKYARIDQARSAGAMAGPQVTVQRRESSITDAS